MAGSFGSIKEKGRENPSTKVFKHLLTAKLVFIFSVLLSPASLAQAPAGSELQQRDTRLIAWGQLRNAATQLLGWEVAIDSGSFPDLDLKEAAKQIYDLRTRSVVTSADTLWDRNIPKPIGRLAAGEAALVKSALSSSFLKLSAIRVDEFPANPEAIRRLFRVARGAGTETIIVGKAPAQLALAESLATYWDMKVAICGPLNETVAAVLKYNGHFGVCLDSIHQSQLSAADVSQLEKIKGRPFVVFVDGRADSGAAVQQAAGLLSRLYHSGSRERIKDAASKTYPALVVLRGPRQGDQKVELSRMLASLEEKIEPVVAEETYSLSSITPIAGPDVLSEEDKKRINTALPQKLAAEPVKPRRLLVVDLNTGYPGHASIPFANYAVSRMSELNAAYSVTFSNDLHNFHYDRLKQYDAVLLNNAVGLHFSDPALRTGLRRFVCEGGGIAAYHGTVYGLLDWSEFGEMLGASGLGANVREADEHAWLKVDDEKSPLNKAFPAAGFAHTDEYYRFTSPPYSRRHIHALLSMDVSKTDMSQPRVRPQGGDTGMWRSDNDYAVSWIHSVGHGRVFYTSLGHSPDFFTEPGLVAHFFAGVQYALGDLPADATPSDAGASDHSNAHCGSVSR